MAAHSSILTWRIHGQRSLVGYSSWGGKESDTTEHEKALGAECSLQTGGLFFFFFGHPTWHVGSWFPDRGSNSSPLHSQESPERAAFEGEEASPLHTARAAALWPPPRRLTHPEASQVVNAEG